VKHSSPTGVSLTKQRRILLLRHQNAADRTAANLKNFGYRSIILPLSKIKLSSTLLPSGPFNGMILTSPIAAQTLQNMASESKLENLPLYCVGKYTAESAKIAGFSQIRAVENDTYSLAAILEKLKPEQNLLYPCAKNRSFDFAAHLARYSIRCLNWEIYSNELISPDQAQLTEALNATDTLFLFSKRTASHFFKVVNLDENLEPDRNRRIFIAISTQVGRTVPRKFLANTYIANEKSELGMIECLTAIKLDEK
jgi:uroporphyrinogen-III synthase